MLKSGVMSEKSVDDPREESITEGLEEVLETEDTKRTVSLRTLIRNLSLRNLKRMLSMRTLKSLRILNEFCTAKSSLWIFGNNI